MENNSKQSESISDAYVAEKLQRADPPAEWIIDSLIIQWEVVHSSKKAALNTICQRQ